MQGGLEHPTDQSRTVKAFLAPQNPPGHLQITHINAALAPKVAGKIEANAFIEWLGSKGLSKSVVKGLRLPLAQPRKLIPVSPIVHFGCEVDEPTFPKFLSF